MTARNRVLLGIVFLLAFAPEWVATYLRFPGDAAEIGVLFGHGEVQYIPPVVALARGELGPTFSSLFPGEGVIALPFLIMAFYAVPFALFGTWGFVLSDALWTTCSVGAAYALLRRFKVGFWQIWLGILLLFFAGHLATLLPTGFPWDGLTPYLSIAQVYGKRFPRPSLSLPVLLVYLILLFDLWRAPRSRTGSLKFAALLGAWSSVLMQANPFDFIALWVAPPAILVLRNRGLRRLAELGRFVIVALASFALVSAPLLLQMGRISNDMRERYGFFRVVDLADHVRHAMYVLKMQSGLLMLLAVAAPLLLAAMIRAERRRLGYLSMISAAAIAGPTLYVLGAPTLIQIYHFAESGRQIAAIVLVLAGLIALQSASRRAEWARYPGWMVIGVLLFLCGVARINASTALVEGGGPRRDLFPYAAPETLKKDWLQVTRTLAAEESRRPVKTGASLLLTNDTTTLYWWTLHGMGNLLMPDVVTVMLKAEEIEYQLCQAGKILGWNAEEWIDFFSTPAKNENRGRLMNGENIWFLGGNKYQASEIHAFAGLEDYPAEYRQQIRDGKSEWQIVLPLSERKRLMELYETVTLDPRALPDYVVWAKRGEGKIRAEPKGPYTRDLENGNYVLWKKG